MKSAQRCILILLVVIGLCLLAGCTMADSSQSLPTDTESDVPQGEHSAAREEVEATPTENPPTQTPEPQISATPTPTAEAAEPVVDDTPLSDTGPWVMYSSIVGVFISNPDGRGLTMFHHFQMADPYVASSRIWAAPQGGRVAVLELIHMERGVMLFPILKVIKVPSGEVELELPLLPEEWATTVFVENSSMSGIRWYETEDGTRVDQIFAAAGVWIHMTWSHDGEMLAFNAAIDGPSTDLYVYHTSDGSIVRLTDGPSESVDPVFSPDDRFILQGGVSSLNWGAFGGGYDYLNLWAVRADDSGVTKVFDKEFYGFEHVLGWRSNTEFINVSSDLYCQFTDLRIVDLVKGVQETLFAGAHNQSAYAPGPDKILLYLSDDLTGDNCERTVDSGVYLLDVNSGALSEVVGIDPNQITEIFWHDQAEVFFVSTRRDVFYSVGPAGKVTEYQAPAYEDDQPPLVSPDGARWFFADGEHNLVAFGDNDGRYSEYEITAPWAPIWTSGSTLVLFFGGPELDYTMYGSAIPGPRPLVINSDVYQPSREDSIILVNQ
jgi:hypothetical protein